MEKPKKVKKPRGKASLIPNKCIACGARCQSSCPAEAIEMNEKGEPIVLADKCIGCQKCVKICPAEALEMFFTPEELEILKQLAAEKTAGGAPAEEDEDSEEGKLKKFLAQYHECLGLCRADRLHTRQGFLGAPGGRRSAGHLRLRLSSAPLSSDTMLRSSARRHSPTGLPRHISSMIPYCTITAQPPTSRPSARWLKSTSRKWCSWAQPVLAGTWPALWRHG